MAVINRDGDVFIIKMFIDTRTGNVYPASPKRRYPASSIPQQFLTSEFVSQEGIVNITDPGRSINMPTNERSIDPKTVTPDIPSGLNEAERQGLLKVKINLDTADAIADRLDGIGERTATRILESRAKEPFTSIDDLNKRLALVGKTWDRYAEQLDFATSQE